jgi:GNAT superfamily N-acetyltransferase
MEIFEDFRIFMVKEWDIDALEDLYRAGGWWRGSYDRSSLPDLVRSSFGFAVVVHLPSGQTVGMGRLISDGVSDAYVQDLVVLPGFRGHGIGRAIVKRLVEFAMARRVTWIALVAEPGTRSFYEELGFSPMEGFVPMLYQEQA